MLRLRVDIRPGSHHASGTPRAISAANEYRGTSMLIEDTLSFSKFKYPNMQIEAAQLEPLTRKQVIAARKALGSRAQDAHIQARRSGIDGVAHVEALGPNMKTC